MSHAFKSRQRFNRKLRTEQIRVETEFGGHSIRYKPIFEEVIGDVHLLIDVEALAVQIGQRAANSKSRRASAQHGAIKVRFVELTKV